MRLLDIQLREGENGLMEMMGGVGWVQVVEDLARKVMTEWIYYH